MTSAEPKGRGLKWKGLTKTEYRCKCVGCAAQTHEAKGTRLDTKKANEKIEYGHKCAAARRGAEAVGRQALAERAAFETKFVLIAERKTQEEA